MYGVAHMLKWWMWMSCLAAIVPAAHAGINKCVDPRTGRVAYSDLPCRPSEGQTALEAPAAGTRAAKVVPAPEPVAERRVLPLQLQGTPQAVIASATAAVRQLLDSGEGCRNTLQRRSMDVEPPRGCRDFLAMLDAWRGPLMVEMARMSIDKEYTVPPQSDQLGTLVDMYGKVRSHEQYALERLRPASGSATARR